MDFLNITMSKEPHKEMLLANICVISAEYPHTHAAIVLSSNNSGRRGITVKCTHKKANCSRVTPNAPKKGEDAAVVAQGDVGEAAEAKHPPRRKPTVQVRPLLHM